MDSFEVESRGFENKAKPEKAQRKSKKLRYFDSIPDADKKKSADNQQKNLKKPHPSEGNEQASNTAPKKNSDGVEVPTDKEVFKFSEKKYERVRNHESYQKFKHERKKMKMKKMRENLDPYPGSKPISRDKLNKYQRGQTKVQTDALTISASKKMKQKEKKYKNAVKQAARSEMLLQEEEGFLEADDGEETAKVSQHEIADAVDITSAQKFFELTMNDFGPYRINYTRNGRFLLFGGQKGHVAAVDWVTKKLLCEINVMESVHDVSWLHQETMYAVAQKEWTYIYDNQGIELHCLKILDKISRMEFLPYHFLLAAANVRGHLTYIDVSIGEKVAGYGTGMGRLDVMCQNPHNAVVALGHTGGTVTMWCPTLKQSMVKMLCHHSGVRSVAINHDGNYMATSGIDRRLKLWDLRTYKMLHSYKLPMGAGELSWSQRGCLSAGLGNTVQVYKDCIKQPIVAPYLTHKLKTSVTGLQFCPYEDVLGVGHGGGFSSLLVPGAGEANFDALESNPFQTKSQRRQAEVKMLLEKIPPEMININSGIIGQVDQTTMQQKIEEHNKIKHLKPLKEEYVPRYKMRGKSKGIKAMQRKKGVIEERGREHLKQAIEKKQKEARKRSTKRTVNKGQVLDRFKKKET